MKPALCLLGLLGVPFTMHCGAEDHADDASAVRPAFSCEDVAAAPFGKRASGATSIATSACGEIAYLDAKKGLHFVPVATGAAEDVMPDAGAMVFTSKGDQLVAIDAAGTTLTVLDTRTRARRALPVVPAAPKAKLVMLPDDVLATCTPEAAGDVLRFHALGDGHVLASMEARGGCAAIVTTPEAGAVTTLAFGTPSVLHVHRPDGTRSSLALLGTSDVQRHASSFAVPLVRGRFVLAFTQIRKNCGDTDCPESAEVVVVDATTGRAIVRDAPAGNPYAVSAQLTELGLHQTDTGALVPLAEGLVHLDASGRVTRLGKKWDVDAFFDDERGTRAFVHTKEDDGRSGPPDTVVLDPRTGDVGASLGPMGDVVAAHDGGAIGFTMRVPCIQWVSKPGVCSEQVVSLRVRTGGRERALGWSRNGGKVLWVGSDGSAIVTGGVVEGEPPATAEPDAIPRGDASALYIDAAGHRAPLSLAGYSGALEVADARGAPLLGILSVGPGPYGGPDAAPRGWSFFRASGAGAERVATALDTPGVVPTRRLGFGIVTGLPDGPDGAPSTQDVFAGSLR